MSTGAPLRLTGARHPFSCPARANLAGQMGICRFCANRPTICGNRNKQSSRPDIGRCSPRACAPAESLCAGGILPLTTVPTAMFTRLSEDVATIRERDPAARSAWEVLTCYPGLHALVLHRWAHACWRANYRWLARFVSQVGRFPDRHRNSPGRDCRTPRVHRSRDGRGDRRNGRNRRRLHDLSRRDARRHVAHAAVRSGIRRSSAV